jgi:ribosomal protein L37AE/L43A
MDEKTKKTKKVLAIEARVVKLTAALEALVRYASRNECAHEETRRGGAIWTICQGCGRKWADDEGGFKPYVAPPEIEQAYAVLAATKGA